MAARILACASVGKSESVRGDWATAVVIKRKAEKMRARSHRELRMENSPAIEILGNESCEQIAAVESNSPTFGPARQYAEISCRRNMRSSSFRKLKLPL
jgi:hypothetical protein